MTIIGKWRKIVKKLKHLTEMLGVFFIYHFAEVGNMIIGHEISVLFFMRDKGKFITPPTSPYTVGEAHVMRNLRRKGGLGRE